MSVLHAVIVLAFGQFAFGAQIQKPIPFGIESVINNTMECVRGLLNTGDEALGIPSHNPLVLNNYVIDLDEMNIPNHAGKLVLNNFVITGITGWETNHIKVDIVPFPPGVKVELAMLYPSGEMVGEYFSDMTVYGHTYKGEGAVIGSLLNLGIDIKLHGNLVRVSLNDLSVRISLDDVSFEIEGFLVDGVDVSAIITEVVSHLATLINQHVDQIDQMLSGIIMDLVNNPGQGSGEIVAQLRAIIERCYNGGSL